jgi:hypothetical protein
MKGIKISVGNQSIFGAYTSKPSQLKGSEELNVKQVES